ncbi:MAG: glycosyltransferase family 2 protein, partial [bacterium]|nr:glycosyltransferase family 2 protein [bacterium]
AKVIADIKNAVPGAEVLIVDSSTDETPAIAESMGARVIRQLPPKGYGAAMDLALRSAAGEIVITLDCDDTYPADFIPNIVSAINEQGYDAVDCSRLERKSSSMPWPNYLANYGFALLASMLFRKRLTDLHSGMRGYKKSMLPMLNYRPSGAALPVELLLLPIKKGYKMKLTFISYHNRIGESTMSPLATSWWTLKRIFWVYFHG